MTLRDDVWDEILMVLYNQGKFKISDLRFDESKRHTVRRVLKEMSEKGWIRRNSEQDAIWRIGPKAEMMFDVSEEVIEQSRH